MQMAFRIDFKLLMKPFQGLINTFDLLFSFFSPFDVNNIIISYGLSFYRFSFHLSSGFLLLLLLDLDFHSSIEQPRFFCLLNFPLQGKAVLVLPGGCWIILQNGNMWCCQIVGGQEASCWHKINFPPWFISMYFSKKCLCRRTLGVIFMFTCVAMSAVIFHS